MNIYHYWRYAFIAEQCMSIEKPIRQVTVNYIDKFKQFVESKRNVIMYKKNNKLFKHIKHGNNNKFKRHSALITVKENINHKTNTRTVSS